MNKPFIVAEMSANHLGSKKRALQIVEAAADAGADAIKVQTWTHDTMCLDRTYTLEHGPWAGRRLFDLYREAYLPWEWHAAIFEHARKLGLIPFSAAFDHESVDYLETLGVDRHKIASFELVDIPLIRYAASKGKPMILSTGMATRDEAQMAYLCARNEHKPTVLVCTSAYPADSSDANLKTGSGLGWGINWGLSDHSLGIGVACAAAALGATYIEKHLTLSRADGGPDAGFSLEPAEFRQLVTEVRRAAASIGRVEYGPKPGEDPSLRRSLWVSRETLPGQPLVLNENIRTARPARGLPCATDLTGKRASRFLPAGTPLMAGDLA